jgi:hypothetical protein
MNRELRMHLNRTKTVGEMSSVIFVSTLIIRAQESVSRGVSHAKPSQRGSKVKSAGQNREKRMEPISNGPIIKACAVCASLRTP